MNNWNEELDKLEEVLRDEIEAGQASGHLINFCRLAVALVGDKGLKYLTTALQRQLQHEGAYVAFDHLEQAVLGQLGDFLHCALERSGATTLVIRYKAKKKSK